MAPKKATSKKTTVKKPATKKAAKTKKPKAAKKPSALDAAAKVLAETKAPMTTKELVEAMSAKGAEGLVWTEETLAAYLADPKKYVPGTKMAFAGLKKPEDLTNLIAYLKAHP